MRFFTSVIASLSVLGLAVAQLPPGTPQCAIPCYVKGAAVSPCRTNATCLCTDETFVSSLETCVRQACIIEDVLIVKNTSNTACGIVPQNSSPFYTETSAIMTGFALFFTILRVVYRQWITQLGLGLDDWTTIVAALSAIPATVLNSRLADFGIGRDIWTLTPYQITQFGLNFWVLTMVYFVDMAILKLSILFFYLRIFPDNQFRRIVWVTVAAVVLFGLSYLLAALFGCWPVSYNWTQWNDRENQGHCADSATIAWANAAMGITLDIWILYLPLSQIASLKLDWRKKVGIVAMFMVGTFVTVVSIIRLASILKFRSSENISRDTAPIALWSTIEIATGVICACMPSMRLILGRLWPSVFGSTTTTHGSSLYPRGGSNMLNSKNYTGTGTGTTGGMPTHSSQPTKSASSRFSTTFARPMSFFSSQQAGAGGVGSSSSAARVDSIAYPGRLGRVVSNDDYDDAIQLRTHVSPRQTGDRSSSESSDMGLPRHGTAMSSGGIHVTRSIEVKY